MIKTPEERSRDAEQEAQEFADYIAQQEEEPRRKKPPVIEESRIRLDTQPFNLDLNTEEATEGGEEGGGPPCPGCGGGELTGACCYPGGGCEQITEFYCAATGGEYHGDGTSCGTVDCPEPCDCPSAGGVTLCKCGYPAFSGPKYYLTAVRSMSGSYSLDLHDPVDHRDAEWSSAASGHYELITGECAGGACTCSGTGSANYHNGTTCSGSGTFGGTCGFGPYSCDDPPLGSIPQCVSGCGTFTTSGDPFCAAICSFTTTGLNINYTPSISESSMHEGYEYTGPDGDASWDADTTLSEEYTDDMLLANALDMLGPAPAECCTLAVDFDEDHICVTVHWEGT